MGRPHVLSVLLRFGRLALVTYVVGMGTWTLLGPNPIARSATPATTQGRAAPAARGAVLGLEAAPLTVSVDGLVATVRTSSDTVAEALRGLGLQTGAGDRLSSPAAAPVVPGQRLALDRGLPVTLIDGGQEVAARSVRGTVADLLIGADIALGPLDRVDRPLAARLNPGDVVRITRIADQQVTVQEDVPFAVRLQPDPNLDRLHQVIVTAGVLGRVENTYLIHVVDGRETARTLGFATTPALQKLLGALESQQPYLLVDNITVRPLNAFRGFKPGPGMEPEVNVQLDVSAFAYADAKPVAASAAAAAPK